jgi:acyl carrier protein
MENQEFIQIIAEAIEIDSTKIELTDKFREFEEWDSMVLLSIIAALDEHYGVIIETSFFKELQTIQDILDYVEKNK